MPYICARDWASVDMVPQQGETQETFTTRCVAALLALDSTLPEAEANNMVASAWAAYILKSATKATVTIEREFHTYQDSIYIEGWFDDWSVTEVHSAEAPQISLTLSSVAKAKAGSGDRFSIAKSNEDKQLVFGWANIAKDAEGNFPIDWDGDVTLPEDLETAAYTYVLKYRVGGEQHQGEAIADLVESVMFTKEKQEALGIPEGILPEGWWVGFHVPDKEVFAKIKSGEYEMFSVQGSAVRTPTGQ